MCEELKKEGNRFTQVELIVQRAAEGTTRLLKNLPGEKGTLALMLNQELPARQHFPRVSGLRLP